MTIRDDDDSEETPPELDQVPPPARSPRPRYPEQLGPEPTTDVRRKRANWKRPTREIPVDQVTAEVKRIVAERVLNRVFAGALTLLLGGSGAMHFHQHDHATSLEDRVAKLKTQLVKLRNQINADRCCPNVLPEPESEDHE